MPFAHFWSTLVRNAGGSSEIPEPSEVKHKAAVKTAKQIFIKSQSYGDTKVTRIKVTTRPEAEDSQLWQRAIPVQNWYRALLVLFHVIMGTTAVQVGLREENVVCEATFSTLMIIAGFLQLTQAALGMYMVIHSIGFEGEELRLCLWMIELVAWTLITHTLLTDICGNRKLHVVAVLYLSSSLAVWIVTLVLWLHSSYEQEEPDKRVEVRYVS